MTPGTDANGVAMVTVSFGGGDSFKVFGVAALAATDFQFAAAGTPAPAPTPEPTPDPTPSDPDQVLAGTDGDDNIVGTDGDDTIWGDRQQDGPAGGNDVLRGGKGNDYLSGGAGSDTYVAERGGGTDSIRWFEAGKDKIDVSRFGWKSLAEMQAAGATMTPGTDANGVAMVTVSFGGGDSFKVFGVAALAAADFQFAAAGTPGPVPTGPEGTAGADTLKGTDRDETIEGKAGDDTLSGGGGHDTFVFNAGDGNDMVTDFMGFNVRPWVEADESDSIRFVGEGMTAENMRMLQSGEDLVITFDGVSDTKVTLKNVWTDAIDNPSDGDYGFIFEGQVSATDSFDTLLWNTQISQVAKANHVTFLSDQNNTVSGRDDSDDVINAHGGNDALKGLSGNDTLRGDAGNDVLDGGAGNDRLDGGTGSDKLTGGSGSDMFVYDRGYGQDTVTDFVSGTDKIDLSAFGLGSMAKLDEVATVTNDTSSIAIDFGNGDRLTVFGITTLAQTHVIF